MSEKERIFASLMKSTLLICLLFGASVQAQYYYKDILVPVQTMNQLQKYKLQQVRSVTLTSFEADGEATEGFNGKQVVSNNFTKLVTTLESPSVGSSQLTSTFNPEGKLLNTQDTTDGSGSTSNYSYDEKGRLSKIVNITTSAGQARNKEVHLWLYDSNSKPTKMLRIINDADTTHIEFVLDPQGNLVEENSKRRNNTLPSVFYYYDTQNRLTDIAGYNQKAKRILPDYVFEYNAEGAISTALIVPEGSDVYQKWYYEYDNHGLKTRESCYNKKKQLLGRIIYDYN